MKKGTHYLTIGSIALSSLISANAYAQPEGSTNTGGSNDHVQSTYSDPWSDGVVDTLSEYQLIAVQAFADGNTILAIDQYKKGLHEILLNAGPDNRLSWTYRTAERTLQLTETLVAQATRSNETRQRAILMVLESAYDQITDYFYKLDISFYTPYRLRCAGHRFPGSYDVNGFERILRHYSLVRLKWFQEAFVMTTSNDGVVPRYSDETFLTVLASVARGLSEDLGTSANHRDPNLFPLAYAQAARSLAKLADRIIQHQAGNGIYGSNQRAVNASYSNLQQIISLLQN